MNEEDLRKTVESLIRGEIQDVINDYVDDQEKSSSGGGFGVVPKEEDKEFKVKIRNEEVDKLIKEYKRSRSRRSQTCLRSRNLVWLTSSAIHCKLYRVIQNYLTI